MDRRMYRGNMGRNYGRNVSPYRSNEPVCDDEVRGYRSEDKCEKEDCYDECFVNRECCPIGMCYVPWQCFRNLYENEFEALANATLFKELDYDWYGRGCK